MIFVICVVGFFQVEFTLKKRARVAHTGIVVLESCVEQILIWHTWSLDKEVDLFDFVASSILRHGTGYRVASIVNFGSNRVEPEALIWGVVNECSRVTSRAHSKASKGFPVGILGEAQVNGFEA